MLIIMILSKIHCCCKIWIAKNCKNHRFRQVFMTFLHYDFIMANITALGHISNFIFYSLDMYPNSISYTKNYQNLSHGLCHPLPGFSMDSLLKWYLTNFFICWYSVTKPSVTLYYIYYIGRTDISYVKNIKGVVNVAVVRLRITKDHESVTPAIREIS